MYVLYSPSFLIYILYNNIITRIFVTLPIFVRKRFLYISSICATLYDGLHENKLISSLFHIIQLYYKLLYILLSANKHIVCRHGVHGHVISTLLFRGDHIADDPKLIYLYRDQNYSCSES